MLRPVPFALPARFLQQLGYDRAVAVARPVPSRLDSPTRWPQPATRLRPPRAARHPRRFVALWDESRVGELGWTDGLHTGLGHLNRQVWLGWLHAGRPLGLVAAWLVEHELCLDGAVSPELGPTRCLLVDGAFMRQ
jgi:hypothetical protein